MRDKGKLEGEWKKEMSVDGASHRNEGKERALEGSTTERHQCSAESVHVKSTDMTVMTSYLKHKLQPSSNSKVSLPKVYNNMCMKLGCRYGFLCQANTSCHD